MILKYIRESLGKARYWIIVSLFAFMIISVATLSILYPEVWILKFSDIY